MSLLKELIRARNRGGILIPILEEQTLIEGKQDSMRRKRGVFHPSELSYDFCPRSWVLCELDKSLYLNVSFPVNTQLRFDVGKALHRMVQDKLGNAGVLFGVWECGRHPGTLTTGFKPQEACPACQEQGWYPKWRYREVQVVDEELWIGGETDGIVVVNQRKYIFEFKTINNDGYSTLVEPLDHHKHQAMWYLDVLDRNRRKQEEQLMELQAKGENVDVQLQVTRMPFSGVIFLYMNKDNQNLREFHMDGGEAKELVMKPDDSVRARVEAQKDVLRETIEHYKAKTLPERHPKCTSPSTYRAQRCPARSKCFATEG